MFIFFDILGKSDRFWENQTRFFSVIDYYEGIFYSTIRQLVLIFYEQIDNEGEPSWLSGNWNWKNWNLIWNWKKNEDKLSNCFSKHLHVCNTNILYIFYFISFVKDCKYSIENARSTSLRLFPKDEWFISADSNSCNSQWKWNICDMYLQIYTNMCYWRVI